MTRVKRGVAASKRRKNLLKDAKGYRWRRKSHYAAAKQALIKAGVYAYRDRRTKKRVMRRLWITRFSIALKGMGLSYSRFIKMMLDKKIELDRKIMAQMAVENPEVFTQLVESIKA
jgi:large subunit ribosomal protein L20